MENYIALLLLIVPGFIARKIYKQTTDIRDDLTQFEESLYCLLNSSIIFIATTGILSISGWVDGAAIFSAGSLFNNSKFIYLYACVAGVLSIMMGFSIHPILRQYQCVLNHIRRKKRMNEIDISHTIFDDIFNDGKRHFVEVYKDDKFIGRGELTMKVEKYKELYLEDGEEGYNKLLKARNVTALPYKGIYIDGKTGIVIKDINLFP